MAENLLPPEIDPREELKRRRQRDFWMGLIGSILINLIIYWLFNSGIIPNPEKLIWLPWFLNIAAILILLLMKRNKAVSGMMASYGLASVIYLCVGFATCFGGI